MPGSRLSMLQIRFLVNFSQCPCYHSSWCGTGTTSRLHSWEVETWDWRDSSWLLPGSGKVARRGGKVDGELNF